MIEAPQRTLFRYRVDYRRIDEPTSRVFHRVVWATDTDDARDQARLADPLYRSTTKTPRKLASR